MHDLPFVSRQEFETLQHGGKPVVAAFLATWNVRCQSFVASLRAFATRQAGAATVVCVDVDEEAALTGAMDVYSVPTILLLQNDRELHREIGVDLAPLERRLQRRPDHTAS